MEWLDIASIIFVCVTMNHLGLIKAVEDNVGVILPIFNCPKCASCWCVFFYTLITSKQIIVTFAVSFLSAYIAIWLELLEGLIDKFYNRIYDTIYPTED